MSNTETLVRISRLYYELGETQERIAELVGLTRPQVSRLLKAARERGIVDIRVRDGAGTPSVVPILRERFGLRELSNAGSSLSRRGRAACARIAKVTGTPTYYYLMRSGGRSLAREHERRCPGCNGRWRLEEPWHRLFDFRCDRCRLVSNIAWEVR